MNLPSAKTIGALSVSIAVSIAVTVLVLEIDRTEAKEVLIHAIDACKEAAIAYFVNR